MQPHSSSSKWKRNSIFRISLTLFFFALLFWVLPLFDVHFDMVLTLFRKGLRWVLSRLGWGGGGLLSFLMLAQCGEWLLSFIEENLSLYVGNEVLVVVRRSNLQSISTCQ